VNVRASDLVGAFCIGAGVGGGGGRGEGADLVVGERVGRLVEGADLVVGARVGRRVGVCVFLEPAVGSSEMPFCVYIVKWSLERGGCI